MANVNYYKAARRHFEDGELLFKHNRHPNAGHLYGFAAECGLKSLLIISGYPSDPNTGEIVHKKPEQFRTHVDILTQNIGQIRTYVSGRIGAKYLALIPGIVKFTDWKTDHRYYDDAKLPHSVNDWQTASKEVMTMLDQALLDGVMS